MDSEQIEDRETLDSDKGYMDSKEETKGSIKKT